MSMVEAKNGIFVCLLFFFLCLRVDPDFVCLWGILVLRFPAEPHSTLRLSTSFFFLKQIIIFFHNLFYYYFNLLLTCTKHVCAVFIYQLFTGAWLKHFTKALISWLNAADVFISLMLRPVSILFFFMQLLLHIKQEHLWEISSTLEQNDKKIVVLTSWDYLISDPALMFLFKFIIFFSYSILYESTNNHTPNIVMLLISKYWDKSVLFLFCKYCLVVSDLCHHDTDM